MVVDRFVVRHAEAPEGATRGADGRPLDPETGLPMPDPDASRLADSVETALRLGEGVVLIAPAARDDEGPTFEERRYSERYTCPYDGTTIDELEPRSFSFNSPHGACPACTGLGTKLEIDPDPDEALPPGALDDPVALGLAVLDERPEDEQSRALGVSQDLVDDLLDALALDGMAVGAVRDADPGEQ